MLRLVELLPMHPSAAFLRAHVQDPAGAQQRQQQTVAHADQKVLPDGGSKVAQAASVQLDVQLAAKQAHGGVEAKQVGAQIEDSMLAGSSGAIEDLVVEVEQGSPASAWKLWHAGLLALLAACVAVGAVLMMKFQGGAAGRVISSPGGSRGHRAPWR